MTANEDAHRNARLRVRPALHVANWPGNSDAATRLASVLVGNAAAHAESMSDGKVPLRLVELPTGELAIEVDDGTPEFPNAEKALAEAKTGSGLWWVSHYRARLSWDVLRDDSDQVVGKTVQVILPMAWGESV
ncbi:MULTISPECIES: hypothetical protein [Streptomyces]|uniref:ATP-binding protein n=1 Tax=Streptomyces tricolor TaxID=68277 RepID=A0ABS9J937_9ACTN|nr:hypothetical protein [Streptomyces tricolor]MCG0062082.1 hypothetical protein [Streptomyces tricolor]